MREGTNPKDAAATAAHRDRLDLLEPAAESMIAAALENGAITKEYGIRNYITVPISYRVYIAAMERHIAALKRGEDLAQDSLIHHLGHLGANIHILAAAAEAGSLVDDRGPFAVPADEEPQEWTDDLDVEVGPIERAVAHGELDACEKLGVCPNCRQRSMKAGKCLSCGYTNGDDNTGSDGYETGAPVRSWADRPTIADELRG